MRNFRREELEAEEARTAVLFVAYDWYAVRCGADNPGADKALEHAVDRLLAARATAWPDADTEGMQLGDEVVRRAIVWNMRGEGVDDFVMRETRGISPDAVSTQAWLDDQLQRACFYWFEASKRAWGKAAVGERLNVIVLEAWKKARAGEHGPN